VRAVLDTNVVVSGAMSPHGTCRQLLNLLTQYAFEICVDDRILAEYDDVLHRPELRIEPAEAEVVLELIEGASLLVTSAPLAADLPDPDDIAFLEVAHEVGAVLVTGNPRHFPKRACKGVTVLSPREFLDLLGRVAGGEALEG